MSEQKVNKLVGRTTEGDYYWLDCVFEDGDFEDGEHSGAVGSVFRPVSEAEKEEQMDSDDAKERFRDLWQNAVDTNNTELGLDDFVQDVIDMDGDEAFFDLSYYDNGCEIAEIFNSELPNDADESEKAEFSECVGGGRCFNRKIKWDKVYDEAALTLALSYEKD